MCKKNVKCVKITMHIIANFLKLLWAITFGTNVRIIKIYIDIHTTEKKVLKLKFNKTD